MSLCNVHQAQDCHSGCPYRMDLSHLDALRDRLARETERLSKAETENERSFREREIAACKKEIDGEYKFLGIKPLTLDEVISDDELLAELQS